MSDYGRLGVAVGINMIEYLDPVEGTVWEVWPYWKNMPLGWPLRSLSVLSATPDDTCSLYQHGLITLWPYAQFNTPFYMLAWFITATEK